MSLIEVIQDHRWWVLAISLPLIVIYGRVLFGAAFGAGAPPAKPLTAPVRRLPPKPGAMVKPGSMPTPQPKMPVPANRRTPPMYHDSLPSWSSAT